MAMSGIITCIPFGMVKSPYVVSFTQHLSILKSEVACTRCGSRQQASKDFALKCRGCNDELTQIQQDTSAKFLSHTGPGRACLTSQRSLVPCMEQVAIRQENVFTLISHNRNKTYSVTHNRFHFFHQSLLYVWMHCQFVHQKGQSCSCGVETSQKQQQALRQNLLSRHA